MADETSSSASAPELINIPAALVHRTLVDLGTCLLTLDDKAVVVAASNLGFAASRFSLLQGHAPEPLGDAEAIGRELQTLWPTDVCKLVELASLRAMAAEGVQRLEHTLHDLNRNPIYLQINTLREPRGESHLIHVTLTDMTLERVRERQLRVYTQNIEDANTRLRLALSGSKVTVHEQDLELRYTFMANAPPFLPDGGIGKSDLELFGEDVGRRLTDIKLNLIATRKPWSGRVQVPLKNGTAHEYDVRIEPRYSAHGEVIGVSGTSIDLADLKKYEDAMRLAMREITHRTKNLLAVIQATARRSAARADSKEAFVESFSNRLEAMSRSHDLLVGSNWTGVDMEALIRRQVEQAGASADRSFLVEGPPLTLTSEAAQHLGMALHELVSNALKYGALSAEGGSVRATWSTGHGDTGMDVVFEWIEQGGPEVGTPTRTGFGTSYLQRAVAMALGGATELDFAKEGLRCRMELPERCFS